MKYKVVALDLDGTLLNEKGQVSDENMSVLQELKKLGVKVVISTGRTYTAFKGFYRQLNLVDPIISCNGAYIYDPGNEKILKGHPLNDDLIHKIIDIFEKNDVFYQYYTPETIYAKGVHYLVEKWLKLNEGFSDEDKINVIVNSDIAQFISENDGRIFKVLGIEMNQEKYDKVYAEFKKIPELEVVQSFGGAIDIMVKGATKGLGLSDVCDFFNVPIEESVAMGDHFNDEDMIKRAGLGVAMENAHPDIKAIADDIAPINTKNGVALYLKKLYNL